MNTLFSLAAAAGLMASGVIHVAAAAGMAIPGWGFVLHFGVLVIGLPIIWSWRRSESGAPRLRYGWAALATAPAGLKLMILALFAYMLYELVIWLSGFRDTDPNNFWRFISSAWMTGFAAELAFLYRPSRA